MDKRYHLVVYEVEKNDLTRKCIIPISCEGTKIKGFDNYDCEASTCADLMNMLDYEGGKLPLPNCSVHSDGWDRFDNYWVILEQEIPPAKGAHGDDKAPGASEGQYSNDAARSEDRGRAAAPTW